MGPATAAIALAIAAPAVLLLYVVYTLPHWATDLAARLNPRVLFFARKLRHPGRSPQTSVRHHGADARTRGRPKLVALTLDDAVDPTITRQAAQLLRQHGARATWFVIGGFSSGEEGRLQLRQLAQEGHELGNHTWHDRPSWKLPPEQLKQELVAVQQLIDETYASTTPSVPRPQRSFFRPGHGFFTGPMLQVAEVLGYQTVLGDVYPHDPWVSNWRLNTWLIKRRVLPGSIIILHDRRPWLIPTLQALLPWLKAQGYAVVTLSELVAAEEREEEEEEEEGTGTHEEGEEGQGGEKDERHVPLMGSGS